MPSADRPFRCPRCRRHFRSYNSLKGHMKEHASAPRCRHDLGKMIIEYIDAAGIQNALKDFFFGSAALLPFFSFAVLYSSALRQRRRQAHLRRRRLIRTLRRCTSQPLARSILLRRFYQDGYIDSPLQVRTTSRGAVSYPAMGLTPTPPSIRTTKTISLSLMTD